MDTTPVVLAGGHGERLSPLTDTTPKALLPIVNRPMILLPLGHLEQCGYSEAIVIAVESQSRQLTQFLAEHYTGSLKLDIVTVGDYVGTAEALLLVRPKLRGNVLVLSGDFVTDTQLQKLVKVHLLRDSAITILFKERHTHRESKSPPLRDIVVLDSLRERVLYMTTGSDCDGFLRLRNSLLRDMAHVTVQTTLTDVHCYVMKTAVLGAVEAVPSLKSIRYELIPYFLRHQYIHPSAPAGEVRAPPRTPNPSPPSAHGRMGTILSSRVHAPPQEDDLGPEDRRVLAAAGGESPLGSRCDCAIELAEGAFCMRANTLEGYLDANLEVARGGLLSNQDPPLAKGEVGHGGFGAECARGEGVEIGVQSIVKKSVVGDHCRIGSLVKINNCVIMDHVIIHDRVTLTGCIVCSNAEIHEDANLKDCRVGASHGVLQGTVSKGVTLLAPLVRGDMLEGAAE